MAGGEFKFEDCLLKHYIRKEVWLPRCREQLQHLRDKAKASRRNPRRLKYFTFCAVGALDVLLLDREKIIRQSSSKTFDSVLFFDRSEEAVSETRKRIPGAIGLPGDFVDVVLETAEGDGLQTPADQPNTKEVREKQARQAQLKRLVSEFPFDVLNLDVEQYLFRSKEQLPGKLTSAIRKLLHWQKNHGRYPDGKPYECDQFTMMFTTQIGPRELADDYLLYLRDTCLQANLNKYAALNSPYLEKSGGRGVADFFKEDFEGAFKLAVPKSLIELAFEEDWHIDGDRGIEVFEFERDAKPRPYRMLHMAMTVRRHDPPRERRAPGQTAPTSAQENHQKAIARLFERPVVSVENEIAGEQATLLERDLTALFKHRERYYQPS